MIPLIGVLLSIYLAFKGLEIFQIALCSPASRSRSAGLVVGAIALIACIVIASVFAFLFLLPSFNTPALPSIL